jgi:hypothetical protein
LRKKKVKDEIEANRTAAILDEIGRKRELFRQ